VSANPALRFKMVHDIVKGMLYLHSSKPNAILHRDLTTTNLLVSETLAVKVADFGLSRPASPDEQLTAAVGCVTWMAPELFRGEDYDEKVDVYSFALCIYEMFTGRVPHDCMEPMKFANAVAYQHFRPHIPDTVPPEWRLLIQACWHEKPVERPSFESILASIESFPSASTLLTASPSSPEISESELGYMYTDQ